MDVLIKIAALVVYYLIVSRYIEGGSVSAGLLATTYIFIPIFGLILVFNGNTAADKQNSKGHLAVLVGSAASVVAGVFIALTLNSIFSPSATDSVQSEASRQATWVARGQTAVKSKLKDPDSVEFRGAYFHLGQDGVPITCGEVNSKNGFGGYSGFQRFISAGSAELTYLEEQMTSRDFIQAWNRFCSR